MAVRLFILQAQYRKPVDFTDEALTGASNAWSTLKEGLLFGDRYGEKLGFDTSAPTPQTLPQPLSYEERGKMQGDGSNTGNLNENAIARFKAAVDDDFNFAGGLAILFKIAKNLEKESNLIIHEEANKTPSVELEQQWQTLTHLAAILGFEVQATEDNNTNGLSDSEIDALVQERLDAKKNKDYAQSDRIRDKLQAQGITLIDKPGGVTIWNRG